MPPRKSSRSPARKSSASASPAKNAATGGNSEKANTQFHVNVARGLCLSKLLSYVFFTYFPAKAFATYGATYNNDPWTNWAFGDFTRFLLYYSVFIGWASSNKNAKTTAALTEAMMFNELVHAAASWYHAAALGMEGNYSVVATSAVYAAICAYAYFMRPINAKASHSSHRGFLHKVHFVQMGWTLLWAVAFHVAYPQIVDGFIRPDTIAMANKPYSRALFQNNFARWVTLCGIQCAIVRTATAEQLKTFTLMQVIILLVHRSVTYQVGPAAGLVPNPWMDIVVFFGFVAAYIKGIADQ